MSNSVSEYESNIEFVKLIHGKVQKSEIQSRRIHAMRSE